MVFAIDAVSRAGTVNKKLQEIEADIRKFASQYPNLGYGGAREIAEAYYCCKGGRKRLFEMLAHTGSCARCRERLS